MDYIKLSGKRAANLRRSVSMNFQECYIQIIQPTFERIKQEYEAKASGNQGMIDILGQVHRLHLEGKFGSEKSSIGIWFTDDGENWTTITCFAGLGNSSVVPSTNRMSRSMSTDKVSARLIDNIFTTLLSAINRG